MGAYAGVVTVAELVYSIEVLVAFNIIILSALFLLLIVEEVRHRRFSALVSETQKGLVSLAHQLRSPLSTQRKYHEFLRSKEFGQLSFAQQEALNKMHIAFGDVVILVERLLARSRIESVPIAADSTSINLVEIARSALEAVTPAVEAHAHRVKFSAPRKTVPVKMDPLLLHGIIDELLMNAISYMRDNGALDVSVKIERSSAVLSVKDTGIGIAENEKKLIFQKYFRGRHARAMAAGNGLGLAFAKKFAEGSGGSIRFTSKERKGSTFFLSLPQRS